MSSPRTLVLHIGEPKTGSTSIQQYMSRFSTPDPQSGLWYVPRPHGGNAHHALAQSVRTDSAGAQFASAFPTSEKTAPGTTAVISSEGLWHFPARKVLNAVPAEFYDTARWDFRVLAYLRPHIGRLLSLYQQQVKAGKVTIGLDAYIARNGANRRGKQVYQRLKTYRARATGGLIVRPFVRDLLVGQDAVADFAAILSPLLRAPVAPPAEPIRRNPSITVPELAILRHAWKRVGQPANKLHRAAVRRLLDDILSEIGDLPKGKLALGPETLALLQSDYMHEAEFLDAKFFDAPVFARELRDAVAGPETTRLDLEAWFDPAQRRLIEDLTEELAAELEVASTDDEAGRHVPPGHQSLSDVVSRLATDRG